MTVTNSPNSPTDTIRQAMLESIRPGASGSKSTLSLSEQIALDLAERIVDDEYCPGDRIHEIAVSERFDVSRGPVREALRILERIGLIEILPRRGAVVTRLSEHEVQDLFEIRAVLFGLACRRVIRAKDLSIVQRINAQLDLLKNYASDPSAESAQHYVMLVQEMGLSLCHESGSEHLASVLRNLFYKTLRYSRLGLLSPERRQQSAHNWQILVQAIIEGNEDTADLAARTLVGDSSREAAKRIRNDQ